MTIVRHKFQRQEGHARVEMFYYSDKGHYFTEYDAKYRSKHGNKTEMHPAIIRLNRGNGRFWVQWSTKDMRRIEGGDLLEVRKAAKDYLDSVLTGRLIDDMDTWTKVIYWGADGPNSAMALYDDQGKIVRFAPWSTQKEQYEPKHHSYYHLDASQCVPFTQAAFDRAKALHKVDADFHQAELAFCHMRRYFDPKDGHLTHIKVLKEATPYFKRWTARLDRAHKKLVKEREAKRKAAAEAREKARKANTG